MSKNVKRNGFTLVEILVVIAIIAVLTGVSTVVARNMVNSAKAANAVSAGRGLMAAYLGCASDHNGKLLEGVDPDGEALDMEGNPIPNFIAKRYPARLAPYLGDHLGGVLGVNKSDEWKQDFYSISVSPRAFSF